MIFMKDHPISFKFPWRLRLSDPAGHYILNLENKYEAGVRYRTFSRLEKGEKITLVVGARSKAILAVYNNLPVYEL